MLYISFFSVLHILFIFNCLLHSSFRPFLGFSHPFVFFHLLTSSIFSRLSIHPYDFVNILSCACAYPCVHISFYGSNNFFFDKLCPYDVFHFSSALLLLISITVIKLHHIKMLRKLHTRTHMHFLFRF